MTIKLYLENEREKMANNNTNSVSAEEAGKSKVDKKNKAKSDTKGNALQKLKAGDFVELENCPEGGFVKEFDGERTFFKFNAFYHVISGIVEERGIIPDEERAGIMHIYQDLLFELRLLTYGKSMGRR